MRGYVTRQLDQHSTFARNAPIVLPPAPFSLPSPYVVHVRGRAKEKEIGRNNLISHFRSFCTPSSTIREDVSPAAGRRTETNRRSALHELGRQRTIESEAKRQYSNRRFRSMCRRSRSDSSRTVEHVVGTTHGDDRMATTFQTRRRRRIETSDAATSLR